MMYKVLLIAMASSIVYFSSTAAAQANPKVGVISGMSGAAAKWNRFQNMGVELAKEELGAEGYPIDLIYEDSATEAPKAIAAFNKLVQFNKVDAILADDFGFVIAPLLPLLERSKTFLVALSLPHDRYCKQGRGYFYSGTSQFTKTKAAFEKFYELNPSVKKVALVIYDDPEWGNTYRDIWKAIAAERSVEVVDEFLSAEFTPDFKSALTKILAKKPDAVFVAHEPQSFLKALRQLNYQGLVVSANNVFEVLADTETLPALLEGVYVVDPKISSEFRDKFRARFKQYPILEAYAGYEGLRSIAAALKANPEKPQVGMREVTYPGVAGQIDYSVESCAGNHSSWALYRFRDGVPVYVSE